MGKLWKVSVDVPSGLGTATGGGNYQEGDSITISATPDAGKYFRYWYIEHEGREVNVSSANPFTFTTMPYYEDYVVIFDNNRDTLIDDNAQEILAFLNGDPLISEIHAKITDRYEYTIRANTEPEGLPSIYQSSSKVLEGDSVTLRARPANGYIFSHWSDGSILNPYTFTPTQDVDITAIYIRTDIDSISEFYRAYVKSQEAINSLPIAFLTVLSASIRQDLLTTAMSTIDVLEVPTNISNGDVLVVYDPKGESVYEGVIRNISDNQIECSQIQSFYQGAWIYYQDTTKTTLEAEFSSLLQDYAEGRIKGSTYIDTLVSQEKGPLTISAETATSGNLPSMEDNTVLDMEEFIYELYQKYGIIVDIHIPFNSWSVGDQDAGTTKVMIPNYTTIKVGNNAQAVRNMSPTTEIAEVNKLVVFSSAGAYRSTYVYTSTNGIVEEPAVNVGRYGKVNTSIVFTDDPIDTVVKANLPEQMYNHYLTFELIVDNNLYNYKDFKLGMPLEVWDGSDYYSTVLTGREFAIEDNTIANIRMICGKVRIALTKKLSLGVVR